MAIDPQIKASLQQTIAVAVESGISSGVRTYGAAANRSARVEDSRRVVDAADGSQVQTSHIIIVENSIGLFNRIWLPDVSSSDATLARLPVAVEKCVDEDGDVSHYEVYV